MIHSTGQLIFFLLTPISHIGASFFFAKPRFGKVITVGIWLLYAAVMLLLPSEAGTLNYFLTLAGHFLLFLATTRGSLPEKRFSVSHLCLQLYLHQRTVYHHQHPAAEPSD